MASSSEYNQKRYQEKREHILAINTLYRQNNREKMRALTKDRRADKEAARRARKLHATPAWVTQEELEDIANVYLEAQYFNHHVDHIIPLQGKFVCGLHVWDNLQLLSPVENFMKHNKHLSDKEN